MARVLLPERQCASCGYFHRPEATGFGQCRIAAPTPTDALASTDGGADKRKGAWPWVDADDGCGQWAPDLRSKMGARNG